MGNAWFVRIVMLGRVIMTLLARREVTFAVVMTGGTF